MSGLRFQTGLLVELESFYVLREADKTLYERLSKMEFSAVLAPRQVGKSSLCDRVAERLERDGIRVVSIADATVGAASVPAEEQQRKWYYGLGSRIAEQLEEESPGLPASFRGTWNEDEERAPLERFRLFLERDVCAEGTRTVIFLDEIDRLRSLQVNLDAFFDLLREIANARARELQWRRIAFCIAGVATIDELSRDKNRVVLAVSGMQVRLDDLTRSQMEVFAPGLSHLPGGPAPWLDAIHHWTNGHPALTQTVGKSLVEDKPSPDAEAATEVEGRVTKLFLLNGRTNHPIFRDTDRRFGGTNETVTDARLPRILALYERVRSGQSVQIDENDPNQLALRIGGLITFGNDGKLWVRNRIFAALFDSEWARERLGARPFSDLIHQWTITKNADLLPEGPRLDEAEEWARKRDDLTIEERTFLDAARAKRLRATRWRQVLLGTALMVAIALVMVLYGFYRRARTAEQAAEQEKMKSRAAELATRASAIRSRVGLVVSEFENLADALILERETVAHASKGMQGIAATVLVDAIIITFQSMITSSEDGKHSSVLPQDEKWFTKISSKNASSTWTIKEGLLFNTLQGHTLYVTTAEFSQDGGRIITGSTDTTARIWNAKDGHLLATLQGHTAEVWSVAFSPNGEHVVTGSTDTTARIWNAKDGHLLATLQGHEGAVRSAVFSKDGERIATVSDDGTVRIWSVKDGHPLTIFRRKTSSEYSAIFSPDGEHVMTTLSGNTIQTWSAKDGRILAIFHANTAKINYQMFSPNGKRIVTVSDDRTIHVWDALNGRHLSTLRGQAELGFSAIFSPSGERIAALYFDKVRIWDTPTGQPIAVTHGTIDNLHSVIFSPDGGRVAVESFEGTTSIWNANDGQHIATLESPWSMSQPSPVFSKDGEYLITTAGDNNVRIWKFAPQITRSIGCALVRSRPVWEDPVRRNELHSACKNAPLASPVRNDKCPSIGRTITLLASVYARRLSRTIPKLAWPTRSVRIRGSPLLASISARRVKTSGFR